MHAMRDREKERTQTVVGKGAMEDKQTKYSSLSGDRGWHIDGLPVQPD